MAFYGLLERAQQAKNEQPNDNHRIIITQRGFCNTIFYSEIQRGNMHNGKVRIA